MQIQVDTLSKRYGSGEASVHVLREVSFGIEPGEFVAIMGTSGSGKTTLLNVMGGLDSHYTGQVTVGAARLGALSERALARLRNEHFGFIFQQFHLLDHLTAQENVALPDFFSAGARTPAEALARSAALLERVGLGHKREARPTELSGGQKQRVAIARALFNAPQIIFCDEPTGSLDRSTGEQIMSMFSELNREEQLTLIVVTHEEHIARMASRILRLEDGVLVSDAPNTDPITPSAQT